MKAKIALRDELTNSRPEDSYPSIVDEKLACKVNDVLQAHCCLHSEKITVHVADRRAFLEGSVQFEAERNLAGDCAEAVFGIRSVYNNLTFPLRIKHTARA